MSGKLRGRGEQAWPRDTEPSAFTALLGDLVERVSGAQAAALVDFEGETVDYAGALQPFDTKLSAAYVHLVATRELAGWKGIRRFVLDCERRSYLAALLPRDYLLVLILGPQAAWLVSPRALAAFQRALEAEAGWPSTVNARWFSADVRTGAAGRPRRVRTAEGMTDVEIVGIVAAALPRERGYRVRLSSGGEVTLFREPGSHWYADEPLVRPPR